MISEINLESAVSSCKLPTSCCKVPEKCKEYKLDEYRKLLINQFKISESDQFNYEKEGEWVRRNQIWSIIYFIDLKNQLYNWFLTSMLSIDKIS